MFGAMSRVISLTWKRLRLGSFSRTDVTVLTSVPFMIAMILPVRPLFSLFIRMCDLLGISAFCKKRNEIFQMAMLEPKLSILDETDSGLDIDALRIVAEGVRCV